jgi:tripartite-type tricarboxylate transporter receptor subunit TctC
MMRRLLGHRLQGWALVAAIASAGVVVVQPMAQAQALPAGLSRADVQRLSRDLTRFNSQDFFERGRDQLEREIRNLEQQKLTAAKDLLRVQEQLPLPQELPPAEVPKNRPSDRDNSAN